MYVWQYSNYVYRWVTYVMGKWTDIKERGGQRKKGLKNPTVLWIISFILTFALTIFPSVFVSALASRDPSMLFTNASWVKAIIDNLYPMVITQSVVTMLQNFSIATPSKREQNVRQFVFCISWTHALVFCLVFYIIGYLAFVYANPPWLNRALYIISGIIAAVGLGSVWQLNHEQERIQKAIEEEKLAQEQARKAQELYINKRTLSAPAVLSDADDLSAEAETGEEPLLRDDTPALK